jgi:hypothetical protein
LRCSSIRSSGKLSLRGLRHSRITRKQATAQEGKRNQGGQANE